MTRIIDPRTSAVLYLVARDGAGWAVRSVLGGEALHWSYDRDCAEAWAESKAMALLSAPVG